MRNPLDLLNKFIGAIIAYGPKNKTKKARMARKAARHKKIYGKEAGEVADNPTVAAFVRFWTKADKGGFWPVAVCPLLSEAV